MEQERFCTEEESTDKRNISDNDYNELLRIYDIYSDSSNKNTGMLDVFMFVTAFITLITSVLFITKIIPITTQTTIPYITVLLDYLIILGIIYSYNLCVAQGDYYTDLIRTILRDDDNTLAQELLNTKKFKYYTLVKIVNNFKYVVSVLGFSSFILSICSK